MDKKYDIVALGEYLVDFSPNGRGRMGNPQYEMNPGGAPINCLAACSRLGGRTGILGAVGNDLFGRFLKEKARDAHIDIKGLQTVETNTTLVFVSVDETGDREFAFVRDPGADTQISKERIDLSMLEQTKFFHFGSLSLTTEPAKSATEFAVKYARQHGAGISYDPNYRAPLWAGVEEAKEWLLWGVKQADIVKMSDGELLLLTGADMEAGVKSLLDMGVKELYITAGSKGAFYFTPDSWGRVDGFDISAVDTTGCGDAFMGAILYQNCYATSRSIRDKTIFANAVGALCATKSGGMCSMPDMLQVEDLIGGRKNENTDCKKMIKSKTS